MNRTPHIIFLALTAAFLTYSSLLYFKVQDESLGDESVRGKMLWQQHNCQSCHQLYGLGGYIGPDLTNVYSQKGPAVIRGVVSTGVLQMKAYPFTEKEMTDLIRFLAAVDATGISDPEAYKSTAWGNITLK